MPRKRKTTRRGNGEGSIYQRKDGRWGASITIGYDEKGKVRRRHVYGRTKKEVQDELSKLQGQKVDGTLGEISKLTVAQFVEKWLEDSVRPALARKTYCHYEYVVRCFINPHVGGVRLTNVTPAHIQGMYSAMERDGHSPTKRAHTHRVMRRAMNVALKWGMIARNPCLAVDPPRYEKRDIQPLNDEQTKQLLKEAEPHRHYALFVLAVTTGLRQGELFGLRWEDVDLKKERLHVRHTLEEIHGQLRLKEPKSASGRRNVHLPRVAVEALHEHRKRMMAEGLAGSEIVFCDTQGGFLRKSNFDRNVWKPLRKAAGIPPIRFHDLRHTAATLLLSQGVHPKVVQERLGHATITITLDTYSHVLPSMQEDAAGKLDRLFGQAGA